MSVLDLEGRERPVVAREALVSFEMRVERWDVKARVVEVDISFVGLERLERGAP